MRQRLETLIQSCFIEYCQNNDISLPNAINSSTRLIGSDSVLDSIGLVTFLAEVEDLLEEELDIEIEIADERAMSRFRSPFTNIDSLSEFLLEKINDVD